MELELEEERASDAGELLLLQVVVEFVRAILIGAERPDRREDERRVEGPEERLGPFQRSVAMNRHEGRGRDEGEAPHDKN